jgi:hypothetical protein
MDKNQRAMKEHKELSSRGFTKLDSGIIYSTLWWQSDSFLRVWIALLALADATGMVRASIPGLAQICLKTVDEVTEILRVFESPDPYSRIKAHEGRKIKTVEGGWIVLNYSLYRHGLRQRQPLSGAERQQRYRDRLRRNNQNVTDNDAVVT